MAATGSGASGSPPENNTTGEKTEQPTQKPETEQPTQKPETEQPTQKPETEQTTAEETKADTKQTVTGTVTSAETAKAPTGGVSKPPYEAMLSSTTYNRLRAQHPAEFEPASVFFTHDEGSAIDRHNSLRVKAALVYEAVTGRHDDDDHMLRANSLLRALAKRCHSRIHGAGRGTGDDAAADKGKGRDEKTVERVLDGIFLVVGFLPKLNEAITSKNADRDSVDQSFKSRHMLEIVTDVIKLKNQQLRLEDLLDVARNVEAAISDTIADPDFKDVKESMEREYKLEVVTEQSLADVIHRFCWYYSPFATKKTAAAAPPDSPLRETAAVAAHTLLDCLHMSVVRSAAQGNKGRSLTGRPSRMPTARDLRRSGVRLQASEDGRAEIGFAQPPALSLPALVYDFKLATVARNLLARENGEPSKPVTRYFQMMNEIVEDAADVRILRRAGVVRGGSSGGQEVRELIKNIEGYATYPSVYMAMDREIDKVREYHDQRMASFFVRNRPGVIWASSVAAISVAAIVASRRRRG